MPVQPAEYVVVGVAGVAAGLVNSVVGSGTLITFPILLGLGVPPVTANVTNTIGLVPGSISGAIGYRRELAEQRDRLVRFASASAIGGVIGAVLLLTLPAGVFRDVVPVLVLAALVLVVIQPRLSRRLASAGTVDAGRFGRRPALLWSLVLGTGVYGGYFGAAQGIILLAILATMLDPDLQRLNGMKNALTALVNGISGVIFAVVAHPNWVLVAIIAVGSAVGGQFGAVVGRRLRPPVLRTVIVVVGVVALIRFFTS